MWFRQLFFRACQQQRTLGSQLYINHVSNRWIRTISSTSIYCVINKKFMQNLQERQGKIRVTQQKMRRKGKVIISSIKEAKQQMKLNVERIVERENIWTVPNGLCVIRIVLSPYIGYLITQSDFGLAFGLVAFAGVTDLLDGLIARTFVSQASKLGSFLDPIADKVLIASLFLSLTYVNLIPMFLTSLIITRDIVLAGAGFYIRYKSLPPPKTIARYFDASHATAQLAPTFISKVNTLMQLATAAATLTSPIFGFHDHPALFCLWFATGATTVASGLSYIYAKNTYKFLK